MNKKEMVKDGFWHEYREDSESVAWRLCKWDEMRQCFIFKSMPQY